MSRFMTSPYSRNWTNDHNLVESTKIKRYIAVAPPKKVVQRKEKKKKFEKKQKKNVKSIKEIYAPLIINKQVLSDESKSCLTDELQQNVCYLSDGSQNSRKRSSPSSPPIVENVKATPLGGNPLRIRFVFKKPKEAEVVLVPEVPVCSTSGRDVPIEIPTTVSVHDDSLPSTSLDKTDIPSESKKRKKHKPSKEERYNSLLDDWVVPCMSVKEDDSSDDWLISSKRQEKNAPAKTDVVMNLEKSGGDSSLPRAQFLPEAGIFALPYTVPY